VRRDAVRKQQRGLAFFTHHASRITFTMETELEVSDHLDERQFELESAASRQPGFGTDASPFSAAESNTSFPLYQPAIRSRAIDWASPRAPGKFFSRNRIAQSGCIYLIVDTSARCASHPNRKANTPGRQTRGALALASLAPHQSVGLISGGEREFDSHPTLFTFPRISVASPVARYRPMSRRPWDANSPTRRCARKPRARHCAHDLHDPEAVPH